MPEIQATMRSAYVPHRRINPPQGGPSLAKQSMADECNVNVIMAQYQRTGLISHTNKFQGDYSDLVNEMDYHEAQNAIIAARDAFDTLSSSIRNRFENNPAKFLGFVDDPENAEELIEMGLRERPMVLPDTPAPTEPEKPETPSSGPENEPE